MKTIITINDNREVICSSAIIGKTYENEATILHFDLTDEMKNKDFYLDFEKPDGTKLSTPRLDIKSSYLGESDTSLKHYVDYAIPNSLLDIKGNLKCEVVLRSNGVVFKTYTIKFNILNSINASGEIPEQYPDFVSEAQKVIDLIDTTGDGTMYLSNDGTYKQGGSGGTSDYNDLENKPITYLTGTDETPIYFNTLETGIYIFNGVTQPYKDADITGNAVNVFVQVLKLEEYISLMYDDLANNEIEYFKVMIDGSSYESKAYNLNDLKPRENIITSSRTTISTRLYDNYNYQVSSIPTRILLNFDENKSVGFRCTFVFKTGDTIPKFQCDYDIKWHGDSIENNVFTINPNKSYTIEFWQDVNCFNANVREV